MLETLISTENELKNYSFEENNWNIFQQMLNFLWFFKEATIIMLNSIYPTLTITIPLYNTLIDHVEDTISLNNIEPIIVIIVGIKTVAHA